VDRKYWENRGMSVYWWNGGKRTLDYIGTYKGFLESKAIVASQIEGTPESWHFEIPLASSKATLDTHGDFGRCADEAIQIFLTLLGDKTTFSGSRAIYKIHWG